jgi:hypothetical protein
MNRVHVNIDDLVSEIKEIDRTIATLLTMPLSTLDEIATHTLALAGGADLPLSIFCPAMKHDQRTRIQ